MEYKSLNCWGFGYLSFRHTRGWRLLTGVPQMLYCSWKYPSHSSTFSSCQLHYDDGSYMFGTSYRVDGICVSGLTSPQCYCKCSAALGTDWMTPAPISPPPPLLGVCALITGQQVIITSIIQWDLYSNKVTLICRQCAFSASTLCSYLAHSELGVETYAH